MERLALQPAPERVSPDERIRTVEQAFDAKLDMLSWFEDHVPESARGDGLAAFDRVVEHERAAREQATKETRFYRWLAARFYFIHFGVHIEDVPDGEGIHWSAVKVTGNVYDITEALTRKAAK